MTVLTAAEGLTLQTDGFINGLAYSPTFRIPSGMGRVAVTLGVTTLLATAGGIITASLQAESSVDDGSEWQSDPNIVLGATALGTFQTQSPVSYDLLRFRLPVNFAGVGVAWTTMDVHVRFSPR